MKVEKLGLRLGLAAGALVAAAGAQAQGVVKVGFIGEMSGPFAEFGKQMETGIQVYQKEHGDTVAGKKVVVIVKDVGGPNPELSKRHAQELVVREKVDFIAGFAFSPNALAVAPIATEAKKPMVIMNAAAGNLPATSPYIVRTSFSLPAIVPPISQWMLKQGYKTAYSVVADYSPGHDVEAAFLDSYKKAGGNVAGAVRTPINTLDFSPYMQKIKDTGPSAIFAFVNASDVAPAFMREYRARKLSEAGTALIGTGDITDEAAIESMGDAALGVVTGYPYSMDHDSPLNKKYVQAFKALRGPQARPTIMSVAGYDGMALIYEALRKTGGKTDGDALIAAMKGVKLESPRGPIQIDPATRDVRQRVYMRKVERVDGRLANVEFETIEPK
ncbi:MAG: ABC transporter substrate-binding protein [Pigmentiphaga sp.]|uniref:ABC transporter substrate-binding protein n=1 Tax=Pigmentiphaga sp. TaxID=1977564 RepID=UPI0029AC1BCF|nr:ABC transporter substrate-binding protein [Pigmentiphaga sp.]MDX3906051.1 ABC transporter substrate-binding protein [Pigmentiphaga sp.]